MDFLVLLFIIFVIVVIFAAATGLKEEEKKQQTHKRQVVAQVTRSTIRSKFIRQEGAIWPFVSGANADTCFMMMDNSGGRLRFIDGLYERGGVSGIQTMKDRIVSVSDIINVELKQDSETVIDVDLKTTSQKKGSLTRAAVGGVVFGGAGAVVGAVSAGSQEKTSGTQTSRTVIKANRLVIGTTDPANPTITQNFKTSEDATDWYHRVLGAVAKQAV